MSLFTGITNLLNKINEFITPIKKDNNDTSPLKSNLTNKYNEALAKHLNISPSNTFHIADLAEKYETSNRGPGYISSGINWGDPGGDSYGSYQIETAQGTMKDYLTTVDDMFTRELKLLPINSPSFMKTWKDLANTYPDLFQESQFKFLCNKHNGYSDALAYARRLGWSVDNFAIQSAIFSTSNQSGEWKNIFNAANIKAADNAPTQINKIYEARAEYFKSLSSINTKIKRNIMQQRCGKNLDMSNYNGSK